MFDGRVPGERRLVVLWYIGRKRATRVASIEVIERGAIYEGRDNIFFVEIVGIIRGNKVVIEEIPALKFSKEEMPKKRTETLGFLMSGRDHEMVKAADRALTAFSKWLAGEEKPECMFTSWDAFLTHLNNQKNTLYIRELLKLCEDFTPT